MSHKDSKNTKDLFFGRPSPRTEATAYAVIGAAIEVHSRLGPGFTEIVYERALVLELAHREIPFENQVALDIMYRDARVGEYRIDLLVDNCLVVELKAVERLYRPLYVQQTLSYLKATGIELGLLINFHVPMLKDGIHRVVRTSPITDPI